MVRRTFTVAVVALWALAAAPSVAHAQQARFETVLSGSGAQPPSPGVGSAVTIYDATARQLLVQMSFSGLTTVDTAAHIHCCTASPGTGTVGVAMTSPSLTNFPLGVTAGTYSANYDLTASASFSATFITNNGGTPAAAQAALAAGLLAGRAYVDIHTSSYPGGEIRGFLTPVYELSIEDLSSPEGNGGTATIPFTITLSPAAPGAVTVTAVTANGTATAGSDYIAVGPTTFTFNPGETTKAFPVSILGDTLAEFDETFTVTLSNPSGALIRRGQALGVITNDDGTPLPPVPANDSYTAQAETPLVVPPPGVLGNDQNSAAGLEAVLQTGPAHGTLALQAAGGFTYTPQTGYTGSDGFTYRARNIAGTSGLATVSIAIPAPTGPVPPTAFRVVGMTGNVVTFGWDPPTLGAAPVGYQIEGGVTPGGVLGAVPLGPAPRFTVALPTGTLYVRVRTVSAAAVSAPTADALVYVNLPVPPSAPANLLGLVSGNGLALAWRTTFAGGAPSAAILDVSGALSASLPLGPVDAFAFAGVPPGTYTFSVRAANATGFSGASNPVTLTFPGGCSGVPQPVEHLVVFAGAGRLTMAWDPAAIGPAPTGYVVQASGAFTGSVPVATRGVDVAVPPGTYTLAVQAANACGVSAPSAPRTVVVP